ncbi:MAG: DUF4857 domain-containing protein [Tannerellaceae bacterium]
MNTKYIHYTLIIVATLLLSWFMPWLCGYLFDKPQKYPFAMYSSVVDDFAYTDFENGNMVYKDRSDNRYTQKQYDSILPFFYYRQLIADNRLPATVKGKAITTGTIQRENFVFRHSPADVNKTGVDLYPLLESRSGRVDLKMPEDYFRITDKIYFVNAETNCLDNEKSELYTEALRKKDFGFPAKGIFGNPTTKKDYDEGYFVIDNNDKLFHLKMVCGRPFVRPVSLNNIVPTQLYVTEFRNKQSFAFMCTAENDFYVLAAPSYELVKLPFKFDPTQEGLSIIGDMLSWTIQKSNQSGVEYLALDADSKQLLTSFTFDVKDSTVDQVVRFIFPFQISMTSGIDKWAAPRIEYISYYALLANLLFAAAYAYIRRGNKRRKLIPALLFILVTGIFGFIALYAFKTKPEQA